jgi:hypothetical protein
MADSDDPRSGKDRRSGIERRRTAPKQDGPKPLRRGGDDRRKKGERRQRHI